MGGGGGEGKGSVVEGEKGGGNKRRGQGKGAERRDERRWPEQRKKGCGEGRVKGKGE